MLETPYARQTLYYHGPPEQEIVANSSPAKLAQVIAPWPKQELGTNVGSTADVLPSSLAPMF